MPAEKIIYLKNSMLTLSEPKKYTIEICIEYHSSSEKDNYFNLIFDEYLLKFVSIQSAWNKTTLIRLKLRSW